VYGIGITKLQIVRQQLGERERDGPQTCGGSIAAVEGEADPRHGRPGRWGTCLLDLLPRTLPL
jgi:hypothetical protein